MGQEKKNSKWKKREMILWVLASVAVGITVFSVVCQRYMSWQSAEEEVALRPIQEEVCHGVYRELEIEEEVRLAAAFISSKLVRSDLPPKCVGVAKSGCGNCELDPGEQCDDGNHISGDGCSSVCKMEMCGNGIVDSDEQCDDGNNVPGDGCSDLCMEERPPKKKQSTRKKGVE